MALLRREHELPAVACVGGGKSHRLVELNRDGCVLPARESASQEKQPLRLKDIMREKAKYIVEERRVSQKILTMLDRHCFLTMRKRRGFRTMRILQWFLMLKRNSSNYSRKGLNIKDRDAPAQ